LRLRARDVSAAHIFRTANGGLPSEARANNCWEPCVYASQQMDGSLRRQPQQLFWYLFSLWRKVHIFLLNQGEKHVLFPVAQEKNEKKPRTFRSIVCARSETHSVGSRHVFAYRKGTQATSGTRRTGRKRKPSALRLRARDIPGRILSPHGVALQCEALHSDRLNFIAEL